MYMNDKVSNINCWCWNGYTGITFKMFRSLVDANINLLFPTSEIKISVIIDENLLLMQ